MAAGTIAKENLVQGSQIEDVKEYIQFLQILDDDEKKEFRGFIHGMQAMKKIMAGSNQKMVV